MRRKDREMPEAFGWQVVQEADYGVLSMVDQEGYPYSVPLSIVVIEGAVYFHSAHEGEKCELFQAYPEGKPVQLVCVKDVHVPDLYDEQTLDAYLDKGEFGKVASKVFTTEFASAIVRGKVVEVKEEAEKRQALRGFCEKYTPTKQRYVEASIAQSLNRTAVYKIVAESITAKRKKYDAEGQEMKWARMS